MTPAQQQLIRTSWNAVEPIADDAATMFYDRLFESDPTVRPLFGYTDMDTQRRALMQMFAVVVRYIDRLDGITPELQALGRRHAGYGVGIDHYASVGRALIGTLEQGKLADLLVVDGNPLDDIRILQDRSRLALVMQGGEVKAGDPRALQGVNET